MTALDVALGVLGCLVVVGLGISLYGLRGAPWPWDDQAVAGVGLLALAVLALAVALGVVGCTTIPDPVPREVRAPFTFPLPPGMREVLG